MAFSSETKETLANLFRHQLLHVGRSRQRRQSGLKSRRSQIRVKEFPFSRQISDEFQNFKFGVFQAKKSDDFFWKISVYTDKMCHFYSYNWPDSPLFTKFITFEHTYLCIVTHMIIFFTTTLWTPSPSLRSRPPTPRINAYGECSH